MANKSFTLSVTCNNEQTKERYMNLSEKMNNDQVFKTEIQNCASEAAVYETYRKHGYTDLSFDDFIKDFKDVIGKIVSFEPGAFAELNEEELENVVGGFNFFNFCTSVVSVIPIAGPIIAGVAKAVKAGIEGKGACEVVKNLAVGVGCALVDAAIMIGTAGVGTAAETTINLVMGGVNAAFDQALD